jgi:RND family efflux transporter MFP subunit
MTEHIHAVLDLHARADSAPPPLPRGVVARRLRRIGWLILLLLAVGAGITVALRRSHALEQRATMAEHGRQYVYTVRATRGGASVAVDLPGTLQGFTEAPISARTSGYVVGLHADIGSRVRKGDRLAEISSPEADQQLAQSEAARIQLDAGAKLASSSFERWQTLRSAGAVSLQAIDERRSAMEQALASLAAADANISRLRQLQAFKHVVAPFDGVITRRNVSVGDLIDAGGSGRALFVLTQTKPLRVNVFVPQAYAMQVKEGARVLVSQAELSGQGFPGKIVRTGQSLDPISRSLQTEIILPNEDGRLMAGAYVSVKLQLVLPEALEVPANTLLFRPEGPRVAVVGVDGLVTLHAVTVGKDFGQSVQILEGLDERDAVVLNPADSLADGDAVTVVAQPVKVAKAR